MLDFVKVCCEPGKKKGTTEIRPKFLIKKSSDLMIRGGDFYAIWDEGRGLWSTDEFDAIRLIDNEVNRYASEHPEADGAHRLYLWDASTGVADQWKKYCKKQMPDSYKSLDEKLIFSNTPVDKKDYASKRLSYPLLAGECPAWDKLIGTLYSPEEREKIEWAIGAIVTGDSKTIQKFMVFYGSAGTGKSTILNVIQKLFEGYYAVFDAKALGSANSSFALESFSKNPLVGIQHDGDLSRIEDNYRINSLVSHEEMTVNEKFKSQYTNDFKAFLFMGTNKPVKITDAKSGLLRRLIDVSPSGNKVPQKEYNRLVKQIDFELGAIAWHCKEVYENDPMKYDEYVPLSMMGASNDFYNFVFDSYFTFKQYEGTTLSQAWKMYKEYIDEANLSYPFSKRVFKEELKNYFKDFQERYVLEDGTTARNYYIGFKTDIFDDKKQDREKDGQKSKSWLVFGESSSIFGSIASEYAAQYATAKGTPLGNWEKCKTKLSDLDQTRLHYVKVPEQHIVIDFDIPGEDGKKNYALNYEAASKWPPTYAELSKSGEGIHLHYIYDGDVSKLARIYDNNPHIEIKVFTGGSSLRRKLSKCNNLPIAHLSSGLPLREEKMINKNVVQSEKYLRKMIVKNLNKEVHNATKPSVDFIAHLLNEAYESGISYDVSDMKTSVIAFALGSTHQADACIKQVMDMKFKSDDIPEPTEEEIVKDILLKPIAFYDIEVFPNLLLINWKEAGIDKPMHRMINPKPIEVQQLIEGYRLIGFNCRRYDNHIIYNRAYMGYKLDQIYAQSQAIINNVKDAMVGNAYNVSYTDVYDFASAGNKKSLKKLEIEMSQKARDPKSKMSDLTRQLCLKIKHHELGLPWDQPVPEELWERVAEYCDDDVYATEAAFYYLESDWIAREILADLAGMTVNDTTNTLTTRFIFGSNKKPQDQFNYRDLSKPVFEIPMDMKKFLEEACPKMMEAPHGDAKSLLPYFEGYVFDHGKSTYRGEVVGEGGFAQGVPGMYGLVALLDIASMHPHSAIAECVFGVMYTKAFRDIVEGRVSIKHEAWDIVDTMLDGKLRPYIQDVKNGKLTSKALANALKTAINSVYGLTSAKFENPFRDPRNKDNIIAKRGALFMIDLKNEVLKRGFKVAHIKTDSIKIPDATPEIIKFVMDFGERYGYTFEHEATYDRMCLVNDAVYIAKYASAEKCKELYGYVPGDNADHGGQWTATGTEFQIPYVFKSLFSKEDITLDDLCETKSVTTALYLDMNEGLPDVSELEKIKTLRDKHPDWQQYSVNGYHGETTKKEASLLGTYGYLSSDALDEEIAKGHDYKFVGKVGQFCPIRSGHGGGILVAKRDDKYSSATGAKGFRWLESDIVREQGLEAYIDREYYENMCHTAMGDIIALGDYTWFVSNDPYISPKYENGHPVYQDEIPFGQFCA